MRGATLSLGLLASVAAMFVVGLSIGAEAMDPLRLLAALLGLGDRADTTIVHEIRAPRLLAAFAIGLALGMSGAALQGLLRNPLADPGVLGVSASAALASTIVLAFGLGSISPFALPGAAVVGALAATMLLAIIAWRVESTTVLLLAGVGLSSLAGAAMALVMNLAPNPFTLTDLVNWSLGSVANRSWYDLALAAPFIAGGLALMALAGRGLSALTLGEEAAGGLGVDLARTRLLVVLGAGLATGGAVSLAGAVGFVGLIAGHVVRPFVGHDPARAMAPAGLFAGLLLLGADIVIRVAPIGQELNLGVVAAMIGGPIFMILAFRLGRRHDA